LAVAKYESQAVSAVREGVLNQWLAVVYLLVVSCR
jgi:hypothetical protein